MDVLETDYENFAVLYSCKHNFLGTDKRENIWIMSRRPVRTDEDLFRDIKQAAMK